MNEYVLLTPSRGDSIILLGYQVLRSQLGLEPSVTRVADIYQYTAVVEEDMRQTLDVDTMPVLDEPVKWRQGKLTDDSPAEFPERFRPGDLQSEKDIPRRTR